MLFKIVHGLVAIPLPSYFEQHSRMTRHSRPLALRQIHTSLNYYKYSFFPAAVVYWNKLPCSNVTLPTLDQFSVAVRSLDHPCSISTQLFWLLDHPCSNSTQLFWSIDHPCSNSTQLFLSCFNVLYILFNTIIFYSFPFPYTFCTVALK